VELTRHRLTAEIAVAVRSDSTFLERLHREGAIDLPPEAVAEPIGERFRG
jgi:hypothetical protein